MRVALSRALVSVFWLATALYALLSAIPFASEQFLGPQLVPAVAAFAAWHRWIAIAVLAVAVAGLAPEWRARNVSLRALLVSWGMVSLLALATSGLSALAPSGLALALSLAALVPAIWLALLDLREPAPDRAPAPEEAAALADFLACAAAALIVSSTHAAAALTAGALATTRWIADLGGSIILHLVVFSGIFLLISLIRGAARMARRPDAAEAWLARATLAAMLTLFMLRVVLSAMSMTGPLAVTAAAAFGTALALVLGSRGTGAPGGVEAALGGCVPRWATRSTTVAAIWLVVVMTAVAAAERTISKFDWNFTVAKTIALGSWLVAMAAALRVVPGWVTLPARSQMAGTVAPLVACVAVLALLPFASLRLPTPANAASTGRDASSRLIVDALAPAAPVETGLYEYLQRHTNIPRSVHVDPVSVDFAPLAASSARRPHIFLFVVDSLRSDYLSPYNAAVAFTPAIRRFAAESTVFERAFTRYGGTGLAVPSIWVGGLLLHKQYVTPFAPMNALAKLLAAEHYALWLSMERIIETIVPATAAIDPLDANVSVSDHRFCRTLQEIRGRLDRLTASGSSVFAYTLPQDIHVATLAREGSRAIDAADYRGFHAAYASRVRRMDACFGEFLEDLKRRGLYDESLIILTSDHGDSLGEGGRIGHAYTIFPEVIQVPLLVHLPASLRSTFAARPAAIAFTSDITPSLYALLGHVPVPPNTIFGLPLFHRALDRPATRHNADVVASSYGSVYGALLDDGRRLYIIDAVSLREHVYLLDGSAAGREVPVKGTDREAGQRAVRATVDEISRFYKLGAPASGPGQE